MQRQDPGHLKRNEEPCTDRNFEIRTVIMQAAANGSTTNKLILEKRKA